MFFRVYVTHSLLCQTDEINTIFQPFFGYVFESTGKFYGYCLYLLVDTNIEIAIFRVPTAF